MLLFVFFCTHSIYGQDSTYQYVTEKKKVPVRFRNELQAEKQYERAELMYAEGDLVEAIELYSSSVELNPKYLVAYYGRAICYDRLKEYRSAMLDYELILKADPTFKEARFNRALTYIKLENLELAIRDFSTLLVSGFSETKALFFRDANLSEANSESKIDKAASLATMEAEIYNYRGLTYLKLEAFDSAMVDFNKAIALHPQVADFWVNRGIVKRENLDKTGARADFRQALRIDSNSSQAKYNLSVLESDKENLEEYYDAVNPTNRMPSAYLNRGYAKYLEKEYEAAIVDYDTALMLAPKSVHGYINRALAKGKLQQLQRAIKDYDQALKLDPGAEDAYRGRGNLYFKLKEYEKAIADYNTALGLLPNIARVHYNRGLSYAYMSNKAKACEDLQKAVSLGLKSANKALLRFCVE